MAFTCPQCGMKSHHPEDEKHGYCGRCHAFTKGQNGAYDRALQAMRQMAPTARLNLLSGFCHRCGEENCPDRYNCRPKE
jgi:hypothetical protein